MAKANRAPVRRRWSVKLRQEALTAFVDRGPTAAAKKTGIPISTIKSWAKRQGLSAPASQATARATAAAAARAEQRRAKLREALIETAAEVLHRISEPHVELKVVSDGREAGSHVERVKLDGPTAAASRDYAVTVGILIDKYRLEMGEDTDRRSITTDVTLRQVPDDELKAGLARVLDKLEKA
jgi:transposase